MIEVQHLISVQKRIEAAGIAIDGLSSDGRIDFQNGVTAEQRRTAEGIVAAYKADQEAEVSPAAAISDEEIDAAKTVADLKAILKRMRNQKG